MIVALNRRLFTIRRMKNHISHSSLMKLVDGIFTSKIRYGIQLLDKVRMLNSDPSCTDLDNIQKVQNKLLRCITKTSLLERVSTESLLILYLSIWIDGERKWYVYKSMHQ